MHTNDSVVKYIKKVKKTDSRLPLEELKSFDDVDIMYDHYENDRYLSGLRGECAGLLKSAYRFDVVTTFCPDKAIEVDFERWVRFINRLGFVCKYMGVDPGKWKGKPCKLHAVNIFPLDYPDGKHILACHTLLRYAYSYRYKEIPKHTVNLFDNYKLNEWFCLYLAHYAESNNGDYKGYYGLLHNDRVKNIDQARFVFPPDPVGVMERLCDDHITNSFDNEITKPIPKDKDEEIIPLREKTYPLYFETIGINPKKR